MAKPQWEYDVKYKFGITGDEYRALLAKQGGRCAICQRKPGKYRLSVDHDHECCPGARSCGKCIRGLLCGDCNQILLGRICQDTRQGKAHAIAVLERAIVHLDRVAHDHSHVVSSDHGK